MHPPRRDNDTGAWHARIVPYEVRKQAVLSQWLQLQWFILPVLAIPLAILLGMRRANGAIIVSSTGAILGVVFDALRATANPFAYRMLDYNSPELLVSQAGRYLFLAAWTLALASSVRARPWPWFALIVGAGYLSFAVTLLPNVQLGACASGIGDSACPQPNQVFMLLLVLAQAVGPIVTIVYALRMSRRRQRQLPEGLVVSSLRDETAPDEDAVSAD